MRKLYLQLLFGLCSGIAGIASLYGHCEIPCGIYNDRMRVKMINEHIDTIKKSMGQIIELEKADHQHANQLVRWIINKDSHAEEIQKIVAQYFMTQRIQPGTDDYNKKLSTLHEMLICAMKCKQTTDGKYINELRQLTARFEKLYFKAETSAAKK